MNIYDRVRSGEAAIAVVGLGYVGMPLALAFAKKTRVIGYDTNKARVDAYRRCYDFTREVGEEALKNTTAIFTYDDTALREAAVIIVAVPTPVNSENIPDLSCVRDACITIGKNIVKDSIVIFESTMYPGVTEDICAPIIEQASGLKCGEDFKIGYSPERINPGDKKNRLENIVKIVAGMDEQTTQEMAHIYDMVVEAGTFKAKSIKVAELAKLEENSQRDINIAFMNEMAMIHEKLGVDTIDVIRAMNTKWNALRFSPGLVGGHCISVDPYYLIYKAEKGRYHPAMVQSGRRINNAVARFVADNCVKQMIKADILIRGSKVAIMGVTYKEDCPDIRNSMVYNIALGLKEYGIKLYFIDPFAGKDDVKREFGADLCDIHEVHDADCVMWTVSHSPFKEMDAKTIRALFAPGDESKRIIVDIKSIFNREDMEAQGYIYWCL